MRKHFSLRSLLVILMGLTAVVTLLGAVGTICLSFFPENFGVLGKAYIPYKPTYQLFVYVKLITAIVMGVVTYATARGIRWFYIGALLTLLVGIGVAAVPMYYSSSLRQIPFLSVAPTNMRFFVTLVTLIVFVIIRFPGIWNRSGLGSPPSKPGSVMTASGASLIVAGLAILTAPLWAGPSHILDGYNLVMTLEVPLLGGGIAMVLAGTGIMLQGRLRTYIKRSRRVPLRVPSTNATLITKGSRKVGQGGDKSPSYQPRRGGSQISRQVQGTGRGWWKETIQGGYAVKVRRS